GNPALRRANPLGGVCGDLVVLGVQMRLLDNVGVQGLESAESDVQGYVSDLGPGLAALIENGGGEVEARCRRGNRSPLPPEDGLISFAILGAIVAMDVGRQRHVSDTIQRAVDIARAVEVERTFAEFAAR